jgi:hypothetical protein
MSIFSSHHGHFCQVIITYLSVSPFLQFEESLIYLPLSQIVDHLKFLKCPARVFKERF